MSRAAQVHTSEAMRPSTACLDAVYAGARSSSGLGGGGARAVQPALGLLVGAGAGGGEPLADEGGTKSHEADGRAYVSRSEGGRDDMREGAWYPPGKRRTEPRERAFDRQMRGFCR